MVKNAINSVVISLSVDGESQIAAAAAAVTARTESHDLANALLKFMPLSRSCHCLRNICELPAMPELHRWHRANFRFSERLRDDSSGCHCRSFCHHGQPLLSP